MESKPSLPGTEVGPAASAASAEGVARALRRVAVLIARYQKTHTAEAASPAAASGAVDPLGLQVFATAAGAAQSGAELDQFLSRLATLGLRTTREELFGLLAASLPDWGFLPPGAADDASRGGAVGALRRLLALSSDPLEGTRRFRETVERAVSELNAGRPARAVTQLCLAGEVARSDKVDWAGLEEVRTTAHRGLAPERLKECAESAERRPLLRRLMDFFPGLSPAGLLAALKEESRRETRKLLLTLLEVHGAVAREAAFTALKESLADQKGADYFHQRNLVLLLRKIPRATQAPADAEVEALARLSEPTLPPALVKEALTSLGQVKSRKGEQVLLTRLGQVEGLLAKGGAPAEAVAEWQQLLDRITVSLLAQATPSALRAVVDHALKGSSALGDPLARLQGLSSHDLSHEADLVERLVQALRKELPVKVLGFVSPTAEAGSLKLVAALSGTPSPAVRSLLAEVEGKFAGQELGRAAARALRAFDAPRKPPEEGPSGAMSGRLSPFGLPTVFLALAEARATGLLTLEEKGSPRRATLALEGGRLRGAAEEHRRGVDAVFQLFERPWQGSFAFAPQAALRPEDATLAASVDLGALSLEGARRYDELQRASGLVPDGARLAPTPLRPTRPPGEPDAALLGALWTKVTSGATPLECEAVASADAFRVRNALAHWVDEGSLALAGG